MPRHKPLTTYKTDAIFHNEFLEIVEDCINESNLEQNQKDEINLILYRNYYEVNVNHNATIVRPTFKPRIIM